MSYRPHETLVAPARASCSPLRLIAGAALVTVLYLIFVMLYSELAMTVLGARLDSIAMIEGTTPVAALVMLASFIGLIAALWLVLMALHGRGVMGLIGPRHRAVAQFLRVGLFLLPLYLFLTILPMPEEYRLQAHLPLGQWLLWLPLALPCLLVQIGAEELAFRGYMQSQLAAWTRNPLIWIGLPSIAFGMLHYSPELAGDNAWLLVVWATLFGAAVADLTARSGTLGPALALHFINNSFAILVTAPLGDLDGLALYTFPLALDSETLAWYILPIEILFTFCAWLTARLALRV